MSNLQRKPSHYDLGIGDAQVDDLIRVQTRTLVGPSAFYLGNILKYILRFQKKNNALDDLLKAQDYLTALIEEVKTASEASESISKGQHEPRYLEGGEMAWEASDELLEAF